MNASHYEATIAGVRSELCPPKISHNNHVAPHTEISSVLYPERILQATQMYEWENEEREKETEVVLCSKLGELKVSVNTLCHLPHRFYPALHPWMKVTVESKHSQTIASFRIHTAHETHAADRCWLFFYLFYVNSPREICWIEVIISAAGVKTLLMKQPRWKVTFVFPAFSCANSSRSGNIAVNATWWQLKEFPCFINKIDRVYISE